MSASQQTAAVGGLRLGVEPRQRRGVEVRERLYEAALAELEARGVEDSRIENVVAAAGTSWGTFFRYFPRKEDVLLHFAARHFRTHVAPVHAAGLAEPRRPVHARTRDFFDALLTPRGSPRVHAEAIAETLRQTERFAALCGEDGPPVVSRLLALMEEGQERGEVRADAPPLTCATVLAAGVVFSTTPALRAVASGQLPAAEIGALAGRAFEVAWGGVGTPRAGS